MWRPNNFWIFWCPPPCVRKYFCKFRVFFTTTPPSDVIYGSPLRNIFLTWFDNVSPSLPARSSFHYFGGPSTAFLGLFPFQILEKSFTLSWLTDWLLAPQRPRSLTDWLFPPPTELPIKIRENGTIEWLPRIDPPPNFLLSQKFDLFLFPFRG